VLCFLNDVNTRWLAEEAWDAPLRDGDSLLFMQAVSGG
jgi:molybdopterin converting factor small subunit